MGSHTELENLTGDAKGKGTSGDPVRLKVLMRRAGADCFVVATKWGNARGAKGAGHPRRDRWVNGKPEEPTGFGRRRQPSLGGTSRINREVYVRFCEGLGAKLPGPTRRNDKGDRGDVGIIRSPVRASILPDHVAAGAVDLFVKIAGLALVTREQGDDEARIGLVFCPFRLRHDPTPVAPTAPRRPPEVLEAARRLAGTPASEPQPDQARS